MFGEFICGVLLASLPLASASPQNLFVSHYDGQVFSLKLDSAASSLMLTQSLQACGGLPSWLTFDSGDRTLYCVDESGPSPNVGNGSLSSFRVSPQGFLQEVAHVTSLPGGVASVIYDGLAGTKYIAIAHYEGSAISTFALPLTPQSQALQKFEFTLATPGPVAGRQDASHPHECILDPTGNFILAPDLGADLIRVFAIDKLSGKLEECNDFSVTPGNGPRHGAIWTPEDGTSSSPVLYLTNELANVVTAYAIQYDGPCLSFKPLQEVLVPYPKPIPSTAAVAEIHMVRDRDVYVSIRYDQGFPPNDSMAFLQNSNHNASLTFMNLTTSYGTTPRTFKPNKAGTLLAIGDQSSSNVAVVRRDPVTGELGELVASLQVGTPGIPGQGTGLSSVAWDE